MPSKIVFSIGGLFILNRCCICEQEIAGTGWFCNACVKQWKLRGKRFKEWPAWVRACKLDEERERINERAREAHEVYFSDYLDAERGAYGEYNEDWIP